ncbi:hypothetical protein GY21_15490 [Cryobacterium roopkundense]|uniref:CheY-like chemotaxis protein n=1 Tax=Cryobacterium roopkundense TaxID=1001240 RepID=A0A099J2V9_9MICO|nr:response regulator [Cryobacterium roopkundense]KGJ72405.1 hypothetical protein GY21_15490 [Cryobacterium roopkundense]MBB5640590.1 CheY-like chemotaxis protein [Cryobacterium roopkundense]
MDSEKPPLANADEAADGTTATNSSADTDRDTDTDTDTDTDIVQHLPVGKEDSERHVALVVEDDAKGAKVLRILLEAEGFRVLVATNGEQGLEIASMQHLSLITLDIRLPRMDGWGFLIRLREYVDLAPVPIVIVAGEADISRALTHGAAAVLEKPISRAALQQSLDALELSPNASRTHRVLVADDDPETIDIVTRFLNPPEYVIERALTKESVIEMAGRLDPDLILLNLTMGSSSGYQVVLALQHNETTRHIPILVVTGKQVTHQEAAAVDSDPSQPVSVIGAENFNRHAFIYEVRRALSSGITRSRK